VTRSVPSCTNAGAREGSGAGITFGPNGPCDDASARICEVVVFARLVIDLPSPPDEAEELLFELRRIDEDYPTPVQDRFERFVQLALRLPAYNVANALSLEICLERLASVPIAGDRRELVLAQDRGEPFDGPSWIERRALSLINDPIEHNTTVGVTVRDGENDIIATATAHVDKGGIQHSFLR